MGTTTCEATFDGPRCGQFARCGVGVVDPVLDRYRCIQLVCGGCAARFMTETDLQFRVLDLALALRVRAALVDRTSGVGR